MSKTERIRGLINELSVPSPSTSEPWMMWFKPDRGSPNYFRVVPSDQDGYDGIYYDVWVETEFSTDKGANHTFKISVVIYDGIREVKEEKREIASLSFADSEESTKQTILNNWETSYRPRTVEAVEEFAAWAEAEVSNEIQERVKE